LFRRFFEPLGVEEKRVLTPEARQENGRKGEGTGDSATGHVYWGLPAFASLSVVGSTRGGRSNV